MRLGGVQRVRNRWARKVDAPRDMFERGVGGTFAELKKCFEGIK